VRNHILFARLLVVIAGLFFAANVIAQSSEAESRPTTSTVYSNSGSRLETEVSARPLIEESRPRTVGSAMTPVSRSAPVAPAISVSHAFDKSLLTAILSHLGADYHFNTTGPESFDCSGLVWRAFQDVGVNFQRGPARGYWATFEVPTKEEQFKFGTLVFFSNLSHVGIVVDEKGFYHSARHGGVMYSPFNEYWLSRIDGFRRVPSQSLQSTAKAKPASSKPASAAVLEQNNQR
jgi:peptidoglycan endopeptidase LytE